MAITGEFAVGRESAERPSPSCDDRFTNRLREDGFQVLAEPEPKAYAPLTSLIVRRSRYVEVGPLSKLVVTNAAPPRTAIADASELEGLTTGRLATTIARVVLGRLMPGLVIRGGESGFIFRVEDVSRTEMPDGALARYLAKVKRFAPALDDEREPVVVTGTLAARRLVVQLLRGSSARGASAAVLRDSLRGTRLRVRTRANELIVESEAPWTFAVRCSNLVETEEGLEHRPRRFASKRGPIAIERALVLGTPRGIPSLLGGAEPRPRSNAVSPPRGTKPGRAPVKVRAAPPEAESVEVARAPRQIGAGFVHDEAPQRAVPESQSLAAGGHYWLWCTIGADVPGAIGGGAPLAASTPHDADLEVFVLSARDGFAVEHAHGTLRLRGDTASVSQAAGQPALDRASLGRKLYFRVKAPATGGRHCLALQFYCRGLLVQALDLTVTIADSVGTSEPMKCTVTYALSRELLPEDMTALGTHSLSVAMDETPSGSHVFSFFVSGRNAPEVASSVSLDSATAQSLLEMARATLREVAWGEKIPFDPDSHSYRYAESAPLPNLVIDLARLARTGRSLWSRLIRDFGGDAEIALARHMAKPGVIQLGLKNGSTMLVPLAMVYDHLLDPDVQNLASFKLCPIFAGGALTCLDEGCPHASEDRTVCPSGFWGFRHSIGVPVGTRGSPDAVALVKTSPLRLVASVYAGRLDLRDAHLDAIAKLGTTGVDTKRTRSDTMTALKAGGFQLLYFYCHGGVEDGIPFLRVGDDAEDPNRISPAALDNIGRWLAPRPLVVINGCHTTAIEPAQALNLVGAFVERAGASGVVGTEITVFEPLAVAMGERLLASLLSGEEVGFALRNARRALLSAPRPNPLGLAYLTFSLATLKLETPPPSA